MHTDERPIRRCHRATASLQAFLLSAVLLAFLLALQAQASTPEATQEARKPTFLLVYRPGPAWIAGKPLSQQRLKEHFEYILDLYAQGAVKLAGGFTDAKSGGAVVFIADGEAQANEIARNDPAVKEGVFEYELRPWYLVDWELHLKRRNEKGMDDQKDQGQRP